MRQLLTVIAIVATGMVSAKLPEIDERFQQCKVFLDVNASDNCELTENIHICTAMVGGQLGSRGTMELIRLGCRKDVRSCGRSVLQKCPLGLYDCLSLTGFIMCLLRDDCTKHGDLLLKYIQKCNANCEPGRVKDCTKPAYLTGSISDHCQKLDTYLSCVLRMTCTLPSVERQAYIGLQCGKICYNCQPPKITAKTSKVLKCNKWDIYLTCLVKSRCTLPKDEENTYKALNCEDKCAEIRKNCKGPELSDQTRKNSCLIIERYSRCITSRYCPISQTVKDLNSYYDCDKSCNADKLDNCQKNMIPIVNSTRDEACSFYGRYLDCSKNAKCENDTKVENNFKYLECGDGTAGILSIQKPVIIPVMISLQIFVTLFIIH